MELSIYYVSLLFEVHDNHDVAIRNVHRQSQHATHSLWPMHIALIILVIISSLHGSPKQLSCYSVMMLVMAMALNTLLSVPLN